MLSTVSQALFDEQTKGLTKKLCEARGWEVLENDFPILECVFSASGYRALRVRFDCTEWDERPPSIELLDQEGNLLPRELVPRGRSNVFNNSAHPITGKPFVCMAGANEYHTHSSHLNDNWSRYRGRSGYSLGEILSQLWNAWKKDRQIVNS